MTDQQVMTLALSVIIPIGILLYSNRSLGEMSKRIDDLGRKIDDLSKQVDAKINTQTEHFNARFDAMEKLFTEKLLRVEQVMDARIKHLEEKA